MNEWMRARRGARNNRNPSVSVVVPTLNEARNLEVILPRLPDVHQVVLADGNSVDDSVAVARRLKPGITVVQQTRKGKGNALQCAFAACTGDIIVMFDADGSADPKEIPAFVDALKAGADFAKGSRHAAGGGSEDLTVIRGVGNRGLNLITNVLLGTEYTDLCYGYNAFWSDILPLLDLPSPAGSSPVWGDGFEIETLLNCRVAENDLIVHEVPSFELSRIFGESNLNAVTDGLRVLRTILAERWGRREKRAHVRSGDLPHSVAAYEAVMLRAQSPVVETRGASPRARTHDFHVGQDHRGGVVPATERRSDRSPVT